MPHKNNKYDAAFKLEAVRLSEPTAPSIALQKALSFSAATLQSETGSKGG